jgi:hypothetical protein
VFKSQTKRFNEKVPSVPGPGYYGTIVMEKEKKSVFRESSTTIIDHIMKVN